MPLEALLAASVDESTSRQQKGPVKEESQCMGCVDICPLISQAAKHKRTLYLYFLWYGEHAA
jgi:hypothetical protein